MGALDSWRFCPLCGEAIEKIEDRAECPACGYVGYANAVPGAEAVCFDARGRVLLGRRAFDPGKGLWHLPGGFLHEDEHPLGALGREIREETALEVEPIDFLGFWLEPYDGRVVLCLAWAANVSGEPVPVTISSSCAGSSRMTCHRPPSLRSRTTPPSCQPL